MEYRELHLRTMSTGEEHPDAKEPVLKAFSPSRSRLKSCWIQVANEHIGILFYNGLRHDNTEIESNNLVVWNWRTGEILFVRSGSPVSTSPSYPLCRNVLPPRSLSLLPFVFSPKITF
jgi:hypothetical protein